MLADGIVQYLPQNLKFVRWCVEEFFILFLILAYSSFVGFIMFMKHFLSMPIIACYYFYYSNHLLSPHARLGILDIFN